MTTPTIAEPDQAADVSTTDGTSLHVRMYGRLDAPTILLVHGMGMDGLVWADQVARLADKHRLIVVDLRGHGRSGDPANHRYADAGQWADDLEVVIRRCADRPPTIVGWSYAGLVIGDYIRKYGADQVAAVYLVAPLRKIGTAEAVDLLDPSFLELVPGMLSSEIAELLPATEQFLKHLTTRPLDDTTHYERLGVALSVPPHVRAGMLGREQDNDDVWQNLQIPLGVAFGLADQIVRPGSSEALVALVPNAIGDEHPGSGHAPFLDDASKFATDLARFVSTHGNGQPGG